MIENLLVSIISDDKPGIVETIAHTISENKGSWQDSQLARFCGKFAGVIRVSVERANLSTLEQGLIALESKQIWTKIEHIRENDSPKDAGDRRYIHVLGPDRQGIVHELSHALAQQNINLANLTTRLSSMPYSGDPLFEASGTLEIPAGLDLGTLHDRLDPIADKLALDISLSENALEMQP